MNALFSKIYGCLAGAFVGSAMGAAVEGMEWREIAEKYGVLDRMLPYSHYVGLGKPGSGRLRPPGTTEDGVERIKLIVLAIKEKKGRITAEDLGRIWLKYINPDYFGVQMEPCDEVLYRVVASGIHPAYAGLYTDFLGVVSFARSCHPIGLINACNPEQAYIDVFDVGRLYQPLHGGGLNWAAAVACGVSEAMKPDATVDSVIGAAERALPGVLGRIFRRAMDLARKTGDPFKLREELDKIYCGRGIRYSMSMAEEVVPKGFAVFLSTEGDLRESIVGAVNMGRDTDCCAAIAGGLAGALSGVSNLPKRWIEQVDAATRQNKYTVSRLLVEEMAWIVHDALMNEAEKARRVLRDLERLKGLPASG